MDDEFTGEDVAHLVAGAAEGGVEGAVVITNAVVAQHDINGLFGRESEITAEAGLEVETVGHLDLVGAEADVGSQVNGKEGRYFGVGEVGFQSAKDLDVVADIIAGAVIGITSSTVILVAGVVEPIEVLVTSAGTYKEVVVDPVATDEIQTEGELLVLVEADAAGGLNGFLKALVLGKCGDGCHNDDGAEDKFSHC